MKQGRTAAETRTEVKVLRVGMVALVKSPEQSPMTHLEPGDVMHACTGPKDVLAFHAVDKCASVAVPRFAGSCNRRWGVWLISSCLVTSSVSICILKDTDPFHKES